MNLRFPSASILLILSFWVFISCASKQEMAPRASSNIQPSGAVQTNSVWAQQQPYVLLISLDGFRHDYLERFQPQHLSAFAKAGVRAASLIPVYPSKTFPNHYSIATGMYPDHHGLLGNVYYNTRLQKEYNTRNRETVEDGRFYGGTPIWVQASKAGMVTASYFFVGTEAPVQGIQPTYWYPYDGKVSKQERIDQTLDWLRLPPETRPHLITLYFSDMDTTGHRYGPQADIQLEATLNELDDALGALFQGLDALELPIDVVIVSDHGMAAISPEQLLPIEPWLNEEQYRLIDNGSMLSIHPLHQEDTEEIFQTLQSKSDHFTVYKTQEVPYFEEKPTNPDWGAIQLVPDAGFYFMHENGIAMRKNSGQDFFGFHGFPPTQKDMHGIFYAKGPLLATDLTLPSFKNIHIYPLLCKLLGLDIPANIDGSITPLAKGLKHPN
ncbi:alkaline phosphatase family protein [Croceiramulus getboli]|nr:ectonucleotide pyrophosphatase/phosphodiesterase [Flavobacteriaceae bacterium YJPT1-3]